MLAFVLVLVCGFWEVWLSRLLKHMALLVQSFMLLFFFDTELLAQIVILYSISLIFMNFSFVILIYLPLHFWDHSFYFLVQPHIGNYFAVKPTSVDLSWLSPSHSPGACKYNYVQRSIVYSHDLTFQPQTLTGTVYHSQQKLFFQLNRW